MELHDRHVLWGLSWIFFSKKVLIEVQKYFLGLLQFAMSIQYFCYTDRKQCRREVKTQTNRHHKCWKFLLRDKSRKDYLSAYRLSKYLITKLFYPINIPLSLRDSGTTKNSIFFMTVFDIWINFLRKNKIRNIVALALWLLQLKNRLFRKWSSVRVLNVHTNSTKILVPTHMESENWIRRSKLLTK